MPVSCGSLSLEVRYEVFKSWLDFLYPIDYKARNVEIYHLFSAYAAVSRSEILLVAVLDAE
jgi:hypothetical protein